MLTSKNFLWLGFFTTLLFITFCVTFNLDKLNPNIVNITPEELDQRELQKEENQTYLSEKETKEDKESSPQFTIIKVSKKENKYINVVDKFNTNSLIKKSDKKIEKKIEKNSVQTAKKEKDQEKKEKEKYTKIIENKSFSFHKKLTTKQKQILNRLAYKTKIAKNSAIFIKSSNSNIKDEISNYLQQIGLEKSKIKIDQSSNKTKRVNLSLRKRG